jgi:hypothetical protein
MRGFPCTCALALALCTLAKLGAQGTTYISNLSLDPVGNGTVADDAWLAQSFTTGNNPQGYTLNTVQAALSPASGSPIGFSVSLYSGKGAYPGSSLGVLNGPDDPLEGGVVDYSGSGLELLPATTYWIVLTADSPSAVGSYASRITSFFGHSATDGWWIHRYYAESYDGLGWSDSEVGLNLQFAVNATSVPEPSAFALVGLAGILFAGRVVRRR